MSSLWAELESLVRIIKRFFITCLNSTLSGGPSPEVIWSHCVQLNLSGYLSLWLNLLLIYTDQQLFLQHKQCSVQTLVLQTFKKLLFIFFFLIVSFIDSFPQIKKLDSLFLPHPYSLLYPYYASYSSLSAETTAPNFSLTL